MSDIYADITFGCGFGDGTEISPYNRAQLDEYLEFNVVNNDVIHMRGNLELLSDEAILFPNAFSGVANGTYNISIMGWGSVPPVVKFTSNEYALNCKHNAFFDWANTSNKTIQIEYSYMVISSDTDFSANTSSNITSIYKTVLFIGDTFYSTTIDRDIKFYGCTFNYNTSYFVGNNVELNDCVIDCDNITFNNISKLSGINNITNINDINSNIQNVSNISEWIITYNPNIISTPKISDFKSFVEFYTDKNSLFYERYNVPISNSVYMQNFRNINFYYTGLFGDDEIAVSDPRISYGAYSFVGEYTDNTYPTSGCIGSFYFGGDYTNSINSDYGLSIEIVPVDGIVSVDQTSRFYDRPTITVEVPTKLNGYIESENKFYVDFVAKKQSDTEYPAFCGLSGVALSTCKKCETENDSDKYYTPIYGGNPLVVDFLACAYGVGDYEKYTPVTYHWYFDYGNPLSATDSYVTCSAPNASYTYCGAYMDKYDVRLFVDFKWDGIS